MDMYDSGVSVGQAGSPIPLSDINPVILVGGHSGRFLLWTFHERLGSIYWVGLKIGRLRKVINLLRRRRWPGPLSDIARR